MPINELDHFQFKLSTQIEERRSWGPLNKHAPLETVRDLTSSHKTREQPHPKSNQKRPGSQEAHATDQGR